MCSPHHEPAGKGANSPLLGVQHWLLPMFFPFPLENGSAEPCGSPQELSSQLCNSLWRSKGIPEEEGKTGLHSVPKRRQLMCHGCSPLKVGQSLLWSHFSSFSKQQSKRHPRDAQPWTGHTKMALEPRVALKVRFILEIHQEGGMCWVFLIQIAIAGKILLWSLLY